MQVWPHLVLREFLAALTVIIFIWIISIVVNAPLEEKANPAVTPNPAKAPWYFVGLQELLAYFDPWIAGVMIPGIAVLGLAAIPYLDVNRAGIGEYVFSKAEVRGQRLHLRVLVLVRFDLHRAVHAGAELGLVLAVGRLDDAQRDRCRHVESAGALGQPPPGRLFRPRAWSMPAVLFPKFRKALGPTRYLVTMILLLLMIGVPAKIVLRLAFDIKYVLTTLWFNI